VNVGLARPVERKADEPAAGSSAAAGTRLKQLLGSERVPVPALMVLVLIGLVTTVFNPSFLSPGNLSDIADQSAIPVVLATGLTFVILMGGIDLSLEGVMAASCLSVSLMVSNDSNSLNLGLWAVPLGCAVGASIGMLAGASVALLRVPSFIVTIGTWQIGLGIAQLLFGEKPPRVLDANFRSIGTSHTLGITTTVWIGLAVVLLGLAVQQYTRFGRYAYVIGGSEETALLSGIRVRRYRAISFAVSGAAAGLAAVLATARSGVGDVAVGNGLLFTTISGVVVGGTFLTGGRGGVLHSAVGVIVMVAIANAMVLGGVSPYIQQAVQGTVVVVAAIVTLWRSRQRLRVIK